MVILSLWAQLNTMEYKQRLKRNVATHLCQGHMAGQAETGIESFLSDSGVLGLPLLGLRDPPAN